MTRLLCLLVLLSGCAAPMATSSAPSTLDALNETLREIAVDIELSDGTTVRDAERVRIARDATTYADGEDRAVLQTADIVRMVVVRQRTGSASDGALIGATPGLLLALGSLLVRSDPDAGPTEQFETRAGATFGFYAGLGVALVGGAIGASSTGRRGPGLYTVIYEGPVERYLLTPIPGPGR